MNSRASKSFPSGSLYSFTAKDISVRHRGALLIGYEFSAFSTLGMHHAAWYRLEHRQVIRPIRFHASNGGNSPRILGPTADSRLQFPQWPTSFWFASPYLVPCTLALSMSVLIASLSSLVNSMFREAKFSSRRDAFVVPGMAIMPCAATQASAIWDSVQPLATASFRISSTMALLL